MNRSNDFFDLLIVHDVLYQKPKLINVIKYIKRLQLYNATDSTFFRNFIQNRWRF